MLLRIGQAGMLLSAALKPSIARSPLRRSSSIQHQGSQLVRSTNVPNRRGVGLPLIRSPSNAPAIKPVFDLWRANMKLNHLRGSGRADPRHQSAAGASRSCLAQADDQLLRNSPTGKA